MLYRSLPGRTVRDSNILSKYEQIKDSSTAYITVFSDQSMAPLTIIVKFKRPRIFPWHFCGMRDLGFFYFAETNSGNTTTSFIRTFNGYSKYFSLRSRHIVDTSTISTSSSRLKLSFNYEISLPST